MELRYAWLPTGNGNKRPPSIKRPPSNKRPGAYGRKTVILLWQNGLWQSPASAALSEDFSYVRCVHHMAWILSRVLPDIYCRCINCRSNKKGKLNPLWLSFPIPIVNDLVHAFSQINAFPATLLISSYKTLLSNERPLSNRRPARQLD